ncbi:ring finger domain-containing protein [Stemphylium lycopersici]|uniref:Ring finger domain-containing protein n=1 Tax=Stemphylium lycopersici TaxID=183478 RepID=A0A364MVM6_STELY|nr:ring finger domain-containing protein [Stemphylium lycopersici]RAR05863.1 ring finger domain-containing protein [Stemphylium lycopersici]
MDNRASPTPPTARSKNSSSSIASSSTPSHAATGSQPQAMSSSNSRAARGATPTATRSASKLGDGEKPARAASKDSLKQKMLMNKDEAPQPSRAEEQLKTLRSEFDSLRNHLTCKICDRLLYQPYTISCGHTYCYTCLCTWFVSNKARKTCPDCRIVVKDLPAPAYVIRDMTNVFIARAELLPLGESLDDHKKWQKDEADAVQLDKDNEDPRAGGLFKGCFRLAHHQRVPPLQVVRDQEDGVDRCPVCTWELEDGGCTQCGLVFDETGEVSWGDSFTGFSDMDEMSEHDTDLDAEMDIEDAEFDEYNDGLGDWAAYPGDNSVMMRRFLEAGIPAHAAAFARRRPISHSEAGSRRSYTQSIVSDVYGDEMDTVEEEDEEGLDEDSSMNDFIDDDALPASSSPSQASSTPGPVPQPSGNRARTQARARRIVESETSSNRSSVVEEDEDEDEEDAGPIRRGVRHPAQTRALHRANGSRSSHETASSTSTDVSAEELDEDTQALLREEGWMLQRDDDDEMGGEEDEDDSDGGRTTVGWEPLANSNDRSRMGGSLTPTADRPRPSAPIRPPSRTGNPRVLNASRGLRRRTSVLPGSGAAYEDGEADDDDSDQDGDLEQLAINTLRTRRSQAHMRNMAAFTNPTARFINRGAVQGDGTNEADTDDNSDTSQGHARRAPRVQRREYDPRISWMFAAHQQALQQHQMAGALIDVEPRAITPLARPRTRNRNRPSPAQAYSPFLPPARLRTPLMDNTSNLTMDPRMPLSPPRRSAMSPGLPSMVNNGNMSRFDRAPSVSSNSNASPMMTPGSSTPTSQHSIDNIAQTQAAAAMDMIDRPQSRVSARPGSANSRRNSGNFAAVNSFPHTGMGLHVQGAALPPFAARGNPWAAFVQARGVRNRNSRQLLRNESSVATLRPANSRVNIREASNQQQGMRPQPSRLNLRSQPSRRQLNNQASTRTLRASEHGRPPPSPTQNTQAPSQPATRPAGLTQDERNMRARELIETRRQALGQRDTSVPARTNPFTQGFQRPANPTGSPQMQQPATAQHVRSNSNESINSTGTVQGGSASPVLGRRRSNRNMHNPGSPGLHSPAQGTYNAPAAPAYQNSYYRPRPGSANGAQAPYESTLTANTRNMSPMMAGPLI